MDNINNSNSILARQFLPFKKQKQSDIVNYLAKKESLEEIFKNKINYLVKSRKEAIAKSELIDINLNLESLKNNNNSDIDYFNMDEEK